MPKHGVPHFPNRMSTPPTRRLLAFFSQPCRNDGRRGRFFSPFQRHGQHPRDSGLWRSLVARPLWEREAAGPNPANPTEGMGTVSTIRPNPRQSFPWVPFPGLQAPVQSQGKLVASRGPSENQANPRQHAGRSVGRSTGSKPVGRRFESSPVCQTPESHARATAGSSIRFSVSSLYRMIGGRMMMEGCA